MTSNFLSHLKERESALVSELLANRAGLDDATGKGIATERLVAKQLIEPNLPPNFLCRKGAVVSSGDPGAQSPTIDRIIYDTAAASPLIFTDDHSLFPIEVVAGMVEITMHLDPKKLSQDIERMAPIRAMREGYYVVPVANSQTRVFPAQKIDGVSPRSFVVGLPASPDWTARDIAFTLRKTQQRLGSPTHVHALYVLGIGFFATIAVENDQEEKFRIAVWPGPQGLFRFTVAIRTALDRWPRLPPGSSVHMERYLPTSELPPVARLSDAGYEEGL